MADYLGCIVEESVYYAIKNETADYTVVIGNQKIRCHKVVLVKNSVYLAHIIESRSRWGSHRSPSFPLMSTPSQLEIRSINLNEVRADIFELMLAHMYGCKMDLSRLEYQQLIQLLESSHLFGLACLAENVSQCLQLYINFNNIFTLIELASLYNLKKFSRLCEKYIAANCKELLSSDFLNLLNEQQLIYILSDLGKELYIDEIDVYKAVIQWAETHNNLSEAQFRDLLSKCVRYELINATDFDDMILPTGHYTIQQYEQDILLNRSKRERRKRIVDTNFIESSKAAISGGYNTDQLLRITPQVFNDQQFTEKLNLFPHVKNHTESDKNYIIVDLGEDRLINYIHLHLYDDVILTNNGNYSFSYYVETSTHRDRKYYKVVDHCGYRCRSRQRIYFMPREVRFIRIVGTTTYVDLTADPRQQYMYIRSVCCQLTSDPFDISRGFWTPDHRITSIYAGCCVACGLNEPNDEWSENNWMLSTAPQQPNHYTYHKIADDFRLWNKRYIMAHLPQPIFSNHLLVNTLNEGKLTYKISVASNDLQYFNQQSSIIREQEIEIDNTIDLNFDHRCVQFIKIQGYQQNANRFKCSQLILP